MFVTK